MRKLVGVATLMFGMTGLVSPATGAQGPSEPGPPDASWGRLVGHVLDATGKPAAGIRSVLQCNWLDGRWGRLEATTDANGQMTVGTPPGQCTLVVNAPRGLSFQGPGLRLLEFAPGETVEVTRRLETYASPPPIEGRLLDDAGQAVSGARVILRSHTIRAGARQWVASTFPPPTVTDATGGFRFASGRAGSYEIVVPALGLSRLVEVPGSTSTPALPLAVIIRGARVPAFRVSGRVETPPGRSANVGAIFLDRADSPVTTPLTIAQTSADTAGAFVFTEVPAGSYRVRIDTSPTTVTGVGNAPAEIFWGITPVVVTNDVTGVVLAARPGPELRAEVRLDDQPGDRNPNQRILLLINAASGRFVPNMFAPGGVLTTRGLLPERYRITASGVPTGYRVKSVTAGGRDVTLEGFDLGDGPIADMVITLTKQLTEVKGVVRDAQDRPDGEAAVLAFPADRRLWTDTGQTPSYINNVHVSQKGNYSVKGLPAGEYLVVATFSGAGLTTDAETLERLAPSAERILVAEGQAITLDLRTRN